MTGMCRLLACALVLGGAVTATAMRVSGNITTDQTWSGTVHVDGDVVVSNGILSILPGTRVVFKHLNNNPVFGDSAHIWLVVTDSGAVAARGIEPSRITFTASASQPGSWGGIRFAGLRKDADNYLINCDIEYAVDGISIENPRGIQESSSPTISYCAIRYCSRSGIYGNVGASPDIQSSMIHDTRTGIFLHEAVSTKVTETYLYNLATGIVMTGGSGAYGEIRLNHITVNNITSAYDSLPLWWRGYAIYCTNTAGILRMENSIIAGAENGINLNNWEFEGACNYWCVEERPLPESLFDDGSMRCGYQADLFEGTEYGDLRLKPGVRAEGAACSGGSNMGAWQEWHNWPYDTAVSAVTAPAGVPESAYLQAHPNPFRGRTRLTLPAVSGGVLSISSHGGRSVRSVSVAAGTAVIEWDGRDDAGEPVTAGMYICRFISGSIVMQQMLVVVR